MLRFILPLIVPCVLFAQVPLEWEVPSALEVRQHNLQISRDDKFSEIVIDENLSGPRFNFSPSAPGIYYWRVRYRPQGYDQLVVSETAQLKISPAQLRPIADEEVILDESKMASLAWVSSIFAKSYIVDLDLGNKKIQIESKTNEVKFELNDSTSVKWRVNSFDRHGEMFQRSQWFSTQFIAPKLDVVARNECNANLSVKDSETIETEQAKIRYVFEWQQLNDSNQELVFKLFDERESDLKLLKEVVPNKNRLIVVLPANRRYVWGVDCRDMIGERRSLVITNATRRHHTRVSIKQSTIEFIKAQTAIYTSYNANTTTLGLDYTYNWRKKWFNEIDVGLVYISTSPTTTEFSRKLSFLFLNVQGQNERQLKTKKIPTILKYGVGFFYYKMPTLNVVGENLTFVDKSGYTPYLNLAINSKVHKKLNLHLDFAFNYIPTILDVAYTQLTFQTYRQFKRTKVGVGYETSRIENKKQDIGDFKKSGFNAFFEYSF